MQARKMSDQYSCEVPQTLAACQLARQVDQFGGITLFMHFGHVRSLVDPDRIPKDLLFGEFAKHKTGPSWYQMSYGKLKRLGGRIGGRR